MKPRKKSDDLNLSEADTTNKVRKNTVEPASKGLGCGTVLIIIVLIIVFIGIILDYAKSPKTKTNYSSPAPKTKTNYSSPPPKIKNSYIEKNSWNTADAFIACTRLIKSNLRHPNTFKIDGYAPSVKDPNTYVVDVTVNFIAKNSFNLEILHTAKCKFPPLGEGEPTFYMTESY